MTNEEFKNKLKEHGLSPASFADEIGLTYSAVIKWKEPPLFAQKYLKMMDEVVAVRKFKKHFKEMYLLIEKEQNIHIN